MKKIEKTNKSYVFFSLIIIFFGFSFVFLFLILLLPKKVIAPDSNQPVPTSIPSRSSVNIYLVDLNSSERDTFGCSDSLVAVSRNSASGSALITQITNGYNELFSIKTQYLGESGLYTALYQSKLAVSKITITGNIAMVYFTGSYSLGGTCDAPRFSEQLKAIPLQFAQIKQVKIFINNIPLEQALSSH